MEVDYSWQFQKIVAHVGDPAFSFDQSSQLMNVFGVGMLKKVGNDWVDQFEIAGWEIVKQFFKVIVGTFQHPEGIFEFSEDEGRDYGRVEIENEGTFVDVEKLSDGVFHLRTGEADPEPFDYMSVDG